MRIPEELLAKIEKDFMASGCTDWRSFKLGYLVSLKRFGSCNRLHKEPWEGAVDRQGGSFDQSEIDEVKSWR